MPKFLGSALDIPAASTAVQAVRKGYVDSADAALAARIGVLETNGGGGGPTTGGQTLAVRTMNLAGTANAGDFVLADANSGSFTVTLPSNPPTNTSVAVKKVDNSLNLVTVQGSDGSTIDGDATCELIQAHSGAIFVFDGANWRVSSTVIFDPGAKNFTFRGDWDNTVLYGVNDVVYYNRNAYVAKLGSTGVTPANDASNATWGLLVLHGLDGAGLNWRGAYSGSTTYHLNDAVYADGASWRALQTTSNVIPSDQSPAIWAPIAAKGADGAPGAPGAPGVQGAPGAPGAPGVKGDTGDPGLVWRGDWISATAYSTNDVVYYDGSSWRAVRANTNVYPQDENGDDWLPVAYRGSDGAPGVQGPQGLKGDPGDPATNLVTSVAGRQGVVTLTKTDVGLSNVDNTADSAKPVSTAQQSAIDTASTADRNRANHTGTQLASTVSDFSTAVDARITLQKGAASGLAPLDSSSKIASNYLPAIAITSTFTVASQAAQLALTAQEGDVAIRTDLSQTYIKNAGVAGTMADWTLLATPTDLVTSVAGRTGAVTLSKTDVGLGNVDNTSDVNKPVSTAQATADGLRVLKAGDTMTGLLALPAGAAGVGGLTVGGDVNLYRSAADTLRTDDSMVVGTNLTVTGTSTFTGTPSAPTAAAGTNTTQLATTAFVTTAAGAVSSKLTPTTALTAAGPHLVAKNDMAIVNAASNAVAITLPASPATGDTLAVKKIDASTNAVTISPNATPAGQTIDNDATLILASEDAAATLVYNGNTATWQVASTAQFNMAGTTSSANTGRKVVASVANTGSSATVTAEAVIQTISTVTFESGRAYSIRFQSGVMPASGNSVTNANSDQIPTVVDIRCKQNSALGTTIGEFMRTPLGLPHGLVYKAGGEIIAVRTAGTNLTVPVVLTMSVVNSNASTNTATAWASASVPRYMIVEDIGNASDYSWAPAIA